MYDITRFGEEENYFIGRDCNRTGDIFTIKQFGFIANSSEAWAIPQFSDMAKICPPFATADNTPFMPYRRDDQTLAR